MSTTTAITIRLEQADYERLIVEAKRHGIQPDALARSYVEAGLPGAMTISTNADLRRQQALEALDHLAELTRDLPSVDAVQIVREGREELEERAMRWMSS